MIVVGEQNGVDWWKIVELESWRFGVLEDVGYEVPFCTWRGEEGVGEEVYVVDGEDCGCGADVSYFEGGGEG